MAIHDDEVGSGSLSPSGRFARMEAALERIENKLDQKADIARVQLAEGRLLELEAGRNPLTAIALQRIGDIERDVRTINLTGTKILQDTIVDVSLIKLDVAKHDAVFQQGVGAGVLLRTVFGTSLFAIVAAGVALAKSVGWF